MHVDVDSVLVKISVSKILILNVKKITFDFANRTGWIMIILDTF